jgi:Transmembrane secretion effector
MLVLAGGIAIGSAIWGVLAGWSLMGSQLIAAGVLLLGLPTSRRWKLGVVHGLDLRPAIPTEPIVVLNPDPLDGPVLVTVSYRVPATAHEEFTVMMRSVERDRRRSGADQWGLFRDLADTDRFLETFVVGTWGEHLRQHDRRTRTADVMMQRAREFVEGDVEVAHLISAYSETGLAAVEETTAELPVVGDGAQEPVEQRPAT